MTAADLIGRLTDPDAELPDDATASELAEAVENLDMPPRLTADAGTAALAAFGDTGRSTLLDLALQLLNIAHHGSSELDVEAATDATAAFGEALRVGAIVFNEPGWWADAIDVGVEAAESSSNGWACIALCETYRARFDHQASGISDLRQAVQWAQRAVELANRTDRAALASNLGAVAAQAAAVLDDPGLHDVAITAARLALRSALRGDPHRATYRANLAVALRGRAAHEADPRRARRFATRAVQEAERAVVDSVSSSSALMVAADCHETLFDLSGDATELATAAELYLRAVEETHGTARAAKAALEASRARQRLYDHDASHDNDLDSALSLARRAVRTSGGSEHADADLLTNLAVCLSRRSERDRGTARTQQRAVRLAAQALERATQTQRQRIVGDCGLIYLTAYERTRRIGHLDRAVSLLGEAAEDPRTGPRSQSNLAQAILTRFDTDPNAADAEKALAAAQQAYDLTPRSHPDRPLFCAGLSAALEAAFRVSGSLDHLKDAARLARLATADGSAQGRDAVPIAHNAAAALRASFEHIGAVKDLHLAAELAVSASRSSLAGTRPWMVATTEAAAVNRALFELNGTPAHLQWMLHYAQLVADAYRPGEVTSQVGSTIASCWLTSFENTGHLADLDRAIRWGRSSVRGGSPNVEARASALTNLANALLTRYEYRGETSDLAEAVRRARNAAAATPSASRMLAGRLSNLSNMLRVRADDRGGSYLPALRAAEQSVAESGQQANRAAYYSNYALVLSSLGRSSDAVAALRSAVHLAERGSPTRAMYRMNLAVALRDLYHQTGRRAALTEAARILLDVCHSPQGGWAAAADLAHGNVLFDQSGDRGDLQPSVAAWWRAETHPAASASIRLQAAEAAAYAHADRNPPIWGPAADAFGRAAALAPQVAWHGLRWESRRAFLTRRPAIGRGAAAATLAAGAGPAAAMETLDSARDLTWQARVNQRRSIQDSHQKLHRLRQIAIELLFLDGDDVGDRLAGLSQSR